MTAAVVQEIGVMGASRLGEDDQKTLRRMASSKREQQQLPLAAEGHSVQVTMVSPGVYGRTVSSSLLEVGATASVAISLLGQEQRRGGRGGAEGARMVKSASVTWKEPMLLMQRISGTSKATARRSTGPTTTPKKTMKHPLVKELQKPSRWMRFWRTLRLDGGKKKVHAARGEWLNYDAQSYAMNFEKDRESPANVRDARPLLPRIDGPGAREIVTVLLRRSPSTNRNLGYALIPKPVLVVSKQESSPPLWQRRSVREPSSLDIKCKGPNLKVRK